MRNKKEVNRMCHRRYSAKRWPPQIGVRVIGCVDAIERYYYVGYLISRVNGVMEKNELGQVR